MTKTLAIIQARLGSTRLPKKVLREINGRPMLDHVVERTWRSQNIDQVVIATTEATVDQELVRYCNEKDWPVFVGSEFDVLSRYWNCAQEFVADYVVRITSDCPLVDPEIIDKVIESQWSDSDTDYTSNIAPRRHFPRGLDVECVPIATLQRVNELAVQPKYREHVTSMIYQRPDLFSLLGVQCSMDLSSWRWTVDTKDDLLLMQKLFRHFGNNTFRWRDAARVYYENPGWQKLNRHVEQKAA